MELFEYAENKNRVKIDFVPKKVEIENPNRSTVGTIIELVKSLEKLDKDKLVDSLNVIKSEMHRISPFKSEPVDCVLWVKSDDVQANDYNPNAVAPPEMELLRHSINHDGYTQPVVTWSNDGDREVIDGFHRTRVCKECDDVKKRVSGYLPVVTVRNDCEDRNDRIASTIRHNRARGKHKVDSMTEIVVELKKRNWSDKKIGKELGMDEDEILRLTQVSGLAELFSDDTFSQSWDIGIFEEDGVDGQLEDDEEVEEDSGRIYHTWDKWECNKAGFYGNRPPKGMTGEQAEEAYRDFLSDNKRFACVLDKVIHEWEHSCEHYLSNEKMNRIAWLGQASLCYELGMPACYRGGYNLLTDEQKEMADATALIYLNKWLVSHDREELTKEEAQPKTKANLY